MSTHTVLSVELPGWAQVTEKRREHIQRVTALLDEWAVKLSLPGEERIAWHDAGRYHDALRDAPDAVLRELGGNSPDYPIEMLHGPAAAEQLQREGERRTELLDAVRFHTVGSAQWGRLGRALYMADYLEPGRKFSRADRAYLAAQVPYDFDATFRQVVRARLEWSLREGMRLYPEAVVLWNSVR
jgi:2-amino-4-hydroxy-6-hydroxymethyldihydropteridine diphosphokinase